MMRGVNEKNLSTGLDAADPEITEKDIEAHKMFELELPDRTLLSGPSSRVKDLSTLFRVCVDMLKAFRVLHFVGPCVTIFGSARVAPGSRYYEMARRMGQEASRLGFTVMTGGGPGIMQAGNQGAYEVGGRSVGVNIELPFEQHLNPYVHRSLTMRHFFTRKVVLVKYSYAFIVMPGGAGTMDEMFETMTLIQTGKLKGFPIILMGKEYWKPLMEFVYRMADEGMISADDPELIFFTDDVDAAVAHLQRHAVRQFGLRRKPMPKPIRILGEKPMP
ncbi:MAG: TIGR00730 family Rossman fold protein [Luteolibacter sp.]